MSFFQLLIFATLFVIYVIHRLLLSSSSDGHFVLIEKEHPTERTKSIAISLGYDGFRCKQMSKSAQIPQNAHSVRPADIDVIAALGDSLTVIF